MDYNKLQTDEVALVDRGWSRWLAWYPVRIAGQKPGHFTWLEFVERFSVGERYRYRPALPPGKQRDCYGEMTRA
jgi:hypothetical protein